MASKLVQYVVVRGDLLRSMSWPTGAVIAQACHACSAVIWLFKDDPNTIEYAKDIDHMHKVVLEAKDEEQLNNISMALTADNIDHKLWIEQPENYVTCLATKPYTKDQIQKYFKKLKLFK
ncbi:putative peptidyl-tRNA hydrolase PTRHD1 [Actinia tenebrosa]|uniref:peptidyl-tRNA hydrolase n=1 Tax=Actinia tenebrosa TaxID=6105 RepID=A0A6P8GX63_ACTTE|nr:putative peptidyl-tRNA hydrolase PTRHD1 [Actinia tenebrosa]XP_031548849.1 putative peptidyl-tRNA hydrolase PTRHD1 [Actinia tenebrosa]